MAVGDQSNVLARINAVLPPWFGMDLTPILTGLLNAFAYAGSLLYSESAYVELQMRITTATDINLDQIANDFFGFNNFQRGMNESDASYRARILASIIPQRATRIAMINILTILTGIPPIIFEPNRPLDCGGYSIAGCGYNVAGGWSDPQVPYQCFIKVFSPIVSSIANVAGWNIATGAWSTPGSLEVWSNSENETSALNAAQIYQAINATKVEGTVCWVQIINP